MDKQSNIDELLSSNILKDVLADGGLLQEDSDAFILLIGPKTPYAGDLSALSSNQYLVYQPDYWDYLQSKPSETGTPSGIFTYRKSVRLSRTDLSQLLLSIKPLFQKLTLQDEHYADFKKQFEWSQEHFASKQLKKTVPFTSFEYCFEGRFNFLIHLLYALSNQVQGFLYGFWTSQSGYLGLTPEVLASWDGQILKTMALAGTWTNEAGYVTLEQVHAKIQDEHQFVVQDIVSKLPAAQVEKTELYSLKYLNHLRTNISCVLPMLKLFVNAVEKLHPTAALGIYPHSFELAREFSQLPLQKERGSFGAPVGYFSVNRAHIFVGIRYFHWRQDESKVRILCGCGVTADSRLADEWSELNIKQNAIVKSFNLQTQPRQDIKLGLK